MADVRQNLLRRFLDRPPRLEGGLELSLEPLDGRRARLHVFGPESSNEWSAVALSVPYPSGLRRLRAADPEAEVVLVERASRGFDAAAAEEGVGYLDVRGRGRLVGPGFVYVATPYPALPLAVASGDVDDDQSPSAGPEVSWSTGFAKPPKTVSPFATKASRVVRALLADPGRRWRLSGLAGTVDMNPGNAHRVLAALTEQGFVERDGDLYIVADPSSLLEAWAEHGRRARAGERMTIPAGADLRGDVVHVLDALEGRAVVSGEMGAELYAPYLPATRAIVHCIDDAAWDQERLTHEIGRDRQRPLRPHGRIVVDRVDAGVGDFGDMRDGFPLVSPAQLYVDLANERGRAREAAEHLRREVLRY